MKAKLFLLAFVVSISSMAEADQAAEKPVSIRNVKMLEEKVIQNNTEIKKENWERRERRWERRERRWERN